MQSKGHAEYSKRFFRGAVQKAMEASARVRDAFKVTDHGFCHQLNSKGANTMNATKHT
jgi:hypothetical protein